MPSDGRLPPRRRARRVVYKMVAEFLELVIEGRVRFGDLEEYARSARLFRKHRLALRPYERTDVDVDELKAAMRDIAGEMNAAIKGRGGSAARARVPRQGTR